MKQSSSTGKQLHCPKCSNYVKVIRTSSNVTLATCPVCKTQISMKLKETNDNIKTL
ncbi:MAG: hypothetical protein ACI4T1_03615 [Christensenellales bacterium]